MTENEALALFKCLADKSRLQILKSLSQEDMYVERLAERLGLTAPTVSFHLKKLSDVGAVRSYKTQYYTMNALQEETLRPSMLSLIQADSSEAALQAQRDEAYRQKVLSSFLVYGKLKSIPTQKKKERIVMEELVKAFEYDRLYAEREVNILLADYHDDFCTLRRDMVGEGLLCRDQRGYWRPREAQESKA